jgi:transcriptional regulator with XRE-family HTH domain
VSLSQADIAKATGLSLPTIKRAESDRNVSVSMEAIAAIRRALESAGVEFTNGDEPGVKLRKSKGKRK